MILQMLQSAASGLTTPRSGATTLALSDQTIKKAAPAITNFLAANGIHWRNADHAFRSVPFLCIWLEHYAVTVKKGVVLNPAGLVLCACALAAQIDNETSWQTTHLVEGAYMPTSSFAKWVKMYGYRNSDSIPKDVNKMTASQIRNLAGMKFIGRFLPHLTGESNYKVILPLAMSATSAPSDPQLRIAYDLAKTGQVDKLTAEQLDSLAQWGPANLAVLTSFLELNFAGRYRSYLEKATDAIGIGGASNDLWKFLSKQDVSSAGTAMDACMLLAYSMRYPEKRKIWPKGGVTPSWADMGIKTYSLYTYMIPALPAVSSYDISKTAQGYVSVIKASAEQQKTEPSAPAAHDLKSEVTLGNESIISPLSEGSAQPTDSLFNAARAALSRLASRVPPASSTLPLPQRSPKVLPSSPSSDRQSEILKNLPGNE